MLLLFSMLYRQLGEFYEGPPKAHYVCNLTQHTSEAEVLTTRAVSPKLPSILNSPFLDVPLTSRKLSKVFSEMEV